MRTLLFAALSAMALTLTVSAEDKKDEKIDAKKLIGKWEPKDKEKGKSAVIEFMKDGKLKVALGADGKEFALDGTYTVEGNKLVTTMKFGEKERKETHTISKLTDTEMVSKDEKGKEETLVRVQGK